MLSGKTFVLSMANTVSSSKNSDNTRTSSGFDAGLSGCVCAPAANVVNIVRIVNMTAMRVLMSIRVSRATCRIRLN
jgi:hypothetical protein